MLGCLFLLMLSSGCAATRERAPTPEQIADLATSLEAASAQGEPSRAAPVQQAVQPAAHHAAHPGQAGPASATAEQWNDRGCELLDSGDLPGAERSFRRALGENAAFQRARMNLALTLALQDRLAESHALYAETLGPAAAHSNLGVLLLRQGRRGEAAEQFHRALALDPALPPARQLLHQELPEFAAPR